MNKLKHNVVIFIYQIVTRQIQSWYDSTENLIGSYTSVFAVYSYCMAYSLSWLQNYQLVNYVSSQVF